jgi:hypothetical protein
VIDELLEQSTYYWTLFQYWDPVGVLERWGGRMAQKDTDELFLYDPNFKAVNKLSTYGARNLISSTICTYMESLVPL